MPAYLKYSWLIMSMTMQHKRNFPGQPFRLILAIATLMIASGVLAQETVDSLQELIGARGTATDGLADLGYTYVRTEKSADASYSYWIEDATGRCVAARVTEGKVASIVYSDGDCGLAPPVPLTANEFETVCGVMTGGETHRYLCRVTEEGDGPTVLRFPDQDMRLVWGDGNRVRIERQGLKPVEATFSISEGETGIFTDEMTYFYISSREAAKLEVDHYGDASGSACSDAGSNASFVAASLPPAGAIVVSPFEVSGCSRTFESNVIWRLLARDGSVVAEGHTSGGGIDGPAAFNFVVDAEYSTGLHHLEVFEPRVSEGEGYPASRTVVPVFIE